MFSQRITRATVEYKLDKSTLTRIKIDLIINGEQKGKFLVGSQVDFNCFFILTITQLPSGILGM